MSTTYTLWSIMDNNETDPKKGSCTIMGRNYRFNGQPKTADIVIIMWHAPAPTNPVQPVQKSIKWELNS